MPRHAFPSMAHQVKSGETELTGFLEDGCALSGSSRKSKRSASTCPAPSDPDGTEITMMR